MNRKFAQRFALGIVLVLAAGLMAIAVSAQDTATDTSGAAATLQNANGETVGPVTLTAFNNNKIVLTAQFAGLPPGFHGIHVHSVGSCEDSGAGPFSAAGEHLNPTGANHPDHVGDLPSLLVHQDGTAYLSLTTDRFTIADLFDAMAARSSFTPTVTTSPTSRKLTGRRIRRRFPVATPVSTSRVAS